MPRLIAPMLAAAGKPFDSADHLFEIKWDGFRTMAHVERRTLRLVSRSGRDVTGQYPELAPLAALPDGSVVDGEIVMLRDGVPDFESLQPRDQARGARRAAALAAERPVRFIAFDLLYRDYRSLMAQPLRARRERLLRLDAPAPMAVSEAVLTGGRRLYESVCSAGLEGIMAKRLDSPYRPGRRSDAWVKVKRRLRALCAIVGFMPGEGSDIQSVAVAIDRGGVLTYAGRVGTGYNEQERLRLARQVRERVTDRPLVALPAGAAGVRPGLYCEVSFVDQTRAGVLRAPVFERMIEEP